jgi:hypothetical protein
MADMTPTGELSHCGAARRIVGESLTFAAAFHSAIPDLPAGAVDMLTNRVVDDLIAAGLIPPHMEVHEEEEWSALYVDGRLALVGGGYLADERVRELVGVVTIQDDAFMRGQKCADGVAQTLEEVEAYRTERERRRERAAELRAEAARRQGRWHVADAARVKRTHQCPGAGCRVEVVQSQLACRSHWFSLPREVRDRVNRTYRNRDRDPHAHRQAIAEAVALLDSEGGEE